MDESTAAGAQEIKACLAEGNSVTLYLDMGLFMTVTTNLTDEKVTTDIGSENRAVLKIKIPYDTTRQNIQVLRYHKDAAQSFVRLENEPADSYTDGTYFVGDNYIALYASGFSTYAIADSGTAPESESESETETESADAPAETEPANKETFIQVSKVRHTKNQIKLIWKPIPGAEGYDVFASFAKDRLASLPVMSVTQNSAIIKKVYNDSKLKKVTSDSIVYIIRAYKTIRGQKSYIAETRKNYTVGLNNKHYSDAKRITVKKSVLTLPAGMSASLKAQVKLSGKGRQVKNVRPLRYLSSDPTVAIVNSKGKVQALKKGSCYIYITAANGLTKCVLVSVI